MPKRKNTKLVHASYTQNKYKPIEERIFFKWLSLPIARALKSTKISPDFFSFLSFFLTIGGGLILLIHSEFRNYLCAFVLYLAFLCDKIDGDLAREKGIAGGKGQYIDGFLDHLSEGILTLLIAYSTGFDNIILVGLSIIGPMIFYYHGVAYPFYLEQVSATYKKTGKAKNIIKNIFAYNRCRHFLLIIILLIINKTNILFYILPLLIIYTIFLYLNNIFIKKLTKR